MREKGKGICASDADQCHRSWILQDERASAGNRQVVSAPLDSPKSLSFAKTKHIALQSPNRHHREPWS